MISVLGRARREKERQNQQQQQKSGPMTGHVPDL
jgi:hypothetical protein